MENVMIVSIIHCTNRITNTIPYMNFSTAIANTALAIDICKNVHIFLKDFMKRFIHKIILDSEWFTITTIIIARWVIPLEKRIPNGF